MNDVTGKLPAKLAGLDFEAWISTLEDLAEEDGHFEPLGRNHSASFIDAGKKLLVTFESYPEIMARSERSEPLGFSFVRSFGWSHLAIIAHEDGWFRDPRLYHYFDRLIDDGFFEDFDQVLFYGSHKGAYAAAAYSVAAPGAHVLAVRPVATLDPAVTGWDDRFRRDRRADFTSRYGYAPDMLDAAAKAWVVYDPAETLDAMQGALFTRSNVIPLRTRYLGAKIETAMIAMHMIRPLIEYAMSGDLTRQSFATLYRARRNYVQYLRALLGRLDSAGMAARGARVCRFVLAERERPYFARKLRELEEAIGPQVEEAAE